MSSYCWIDQANGSLWQKKSEEFPSQESQCLARAGKSFITCRNNWVEAALLRRAQQVVIFVKSLANTVPEQQQFAPEHNLNLPLFEKNIIFLKSLGK